MGSGRNKAQRPPSEDAPGHAPTVGTPGRPFLQPAPTGYQTCVHGTHKDTPNSLVRDQHELSKGGRAEATTLGHRHVMSATRSFPPRSLLSLNTAAHCRGPMHPTGLGPRVTRTTVLHHRLSMAKWDGASQEPHRSHSSGPLHTAEGSARSVRGRSSGCPLPRGPWSGGDTETVSKPQRP